MAVTRTLYFTTGISCCRSGDIAYVTALRIVHVSVTKDRFNTSLTVWRDVAADRFYNKYYEMGENECTGMSKTLRLCNFIFTNIRAEEEEELPTAPITVTEYIKEIESLIRDSKYNIEVMKDDITNILVIPSEKRTSSQKAEIKRLDNEIRKENEFIIEYENEVKKLKEQYDIK